MKHGAGYRSIPSDPWEEEPAAAGVLDDRVEGQRWYKVGRRAHGTCALAGILLCLRHGVCLLCHPTPAKGVGGSLVAGLAGLAGTRQVQQHHFGILGGGKAGSG